MTGDNLKAVFARSIGITQPWYIEKSQYDEEKRVVNIYVQGEKEALYACPVCGVLCERYGEEETVHRWRHGDVMYYPSYVHCRRPRVNCGVHGVHTAAIPWARERSRFTALCEAHMELALSNAPMLPGDGPRG